MKKSEYYSEPSDNSIFCLEMSELTEAEIGRLKVSDLKIELEKRGLPTKGVKNDLKTRLLQVRVR